MIFLQALNTAKEVRAKSEIRTIQSVILSSHQNLIRSKQFDENPTWPWSLDLGQDPGEISVMILMMLMILGVIRLML